jgi:hypothetical protein
MTFNQFYFALVMIGIPLYLGIATRREDWNWIAISIVLCGGIGILLWVALWAWVFDDIKYFPSWILFQESDRTGFRVIGVSYGLIVSSVLLALRRLASR